MLVLLIVFFIFILVWYYWQHVSLIVNKSSAGFNNDDEDADYDDTIKRSLIMKKLNSSEPTRHLRGSYLVQSETSYLISLFGSRWRHSREGSGADNKNDIDKHFQSFHSCYFSAAGVNSHLYISFRVTTNHQYYVPSNSLACRVLTKPSWKLRSLTMTKFYCKINKGLHSITLFRVMKLSPFLTLLTTTYYLVNFYINERR